MGLLQDLRESLRQLRRHPGFTLAALLTLTLALGGVTAVFAIADPVLFRPLPYPRSDRLVRLGAMTERGPDDLFGAEYAQLLRDRGAFSALTSTGLQELGIVQSSGGTPESVFLAGVSGEFFDVFSVEPVLGRRFRADEYRDSRVVILTHAAWQKYFSQRPDVVGQSLVFGGSQPQSFDVVGVLPPDFVMPPVRVAADTASGGCVGLVPTALNPRALANPNYFKAPFARLRDGADMDAAHATVQRAIDVVASADPAFAKGQHRPLVRPMSEAIHADARAPMFMLLSVTGLVMLLASANLAHLFMARLAGRMRELATRAALGASRMRILRLLVVEAALVAVTGVTAAILLGELLVRAVLQFLPASFERLWGSAFDLRVMAVAGLVATISLFVFGLLPAMRVLRLDLRSVIARSPSARSGLFTRGALLLAQTATVVAVLVTALLLATSFARLAAQDLGFDPHDIHTLRIASPVNRGQDANRKRHTNLEMREQVADRLDRPVALADGIPGFSIPFEVWPADGGFGSYQTIGYPVSASFFDVFRIRLARGRLMTEAESLSGAPVIVIDERAAALAWPGKDSIGRAMQDSEGVVRHVIGVVEALQTRIFGTRFQAPTAFVPLPAVHQRPYVLLWRGGATAAEQRAIQEDMRQVDPQAAALVRPFTVFDQQLQRPRFLAMLLAALGLLAIVLTVVGLYGVVSHDVAQRTREMGIRIALGAEARRIARLVVLQALKPAVAGVALGLAISLWWTESLRSLLYGFTPHDWRIFVGSAVVVILLVALACLAPVRRATRVDPSIALKAE